MTKNICIILHVTQKSSNTWKQLWLYYLSLRFNRVFYVYIFLFFFNAKVSLNYYFDSPNGLITTCLFFFLFCLHHLCYMLYMSLLKTMYYVNVWNKMCSVLTAFWTWYRTSAYISIENSIFEWSRSHYNWYIMYILVVFSYTIN